MRNGEQATVLAKNPVEAGGRHNYWVGVMSDGAPITWSEDGNYWAGGKEHHYDLIAPYPAPVVRDLVVSEVGMGTTAPGDYLVSEGQYRFRLTWNPAEPTVLQVEPGALPWRNGGDIR